MMTIRDTNHSGSFIRSTSTTILADARFRSVHRVCAFFTRDHILFQVIDEKQSKTTTHFCKLKQINDELKRQR
jgi:ribosomal protein L18